MVAYEIVVRGNRAMVISKILVVEERRPATIGVLGNGENSPSSFMDVPHRSLSCASLASCDHGHQRGFARLAGKAIVHCL